MERRLLPVSRYTSKGTAVYAFITAKPSKPVVELLEPKTSTATKVKTQQVFSPVQSAAVSNINKYVSVLKEVMGF